MFFLPTFVAIQNQATACVFSGRDPSVLPPMATFFLCAPSSPFLVPVAQTGLHVGNLSQKQTEQCQQTNRQILGGEPFPEKTLSHGIPPFLETDRRRASPFPSSRISLRNADGPSHPPNHTNDQVDGGFLPIFRMMIGRILWIEQ